MYRFVLALLIITRHYIAFFLGSGTLAPLVADFTLDGAFLSATFTSGNLFVLFFFIASFGLSAQGATLEQVVATHHQALADNGQPL